MGEISPAPENLINRNFHAATPNEKWLTDITEFQIPAGKVYLSPMIDCFDGLVVSWTIGTRPDADLVNTMLDAAIERVASSPDAVTRARICRAIQAEAGNTGFPQGAIAATDIGFGLGLGRETGCNKGECEGE